jgi:hypothetical protein
MKSPEETLTSVFKVLNDSSLDLKERIKILRYIGICNLVSPRPQRVQSMILSHCKDILTAVHRMPDDEWNLIHDECVEELIKVYHDQSIELTVKQRNHN